MSIIDGIIQQYNSKGRLSIEVPEWADLLPDGKIYYTPFTLQERYKLIPELEGKNLDFVVSAIVMKSEDKDGNKLFTLSDKPKLKRFCEYEILDRIASKMLAGGGESELGEP